MRRRRIRRRKMIINSWRGRLLFRKLARRVKKVSRIVRGGFRF